jgi:hypothetical protein
MLLGDRHALRLKIIEGVHSGVCHVAFVFFKIAIVLDGAAVL